jgi:hypothetical protein
MPLYMTVEKRLTMTIEPHRGSEYVAWDHHVICLHEFDISSSDLLNDNRVVPISMRNSI